MIGECGHSARRVVARQPAAGRVSAIRRKLACTCKCSPPADVAVRLVCLPASFAELELYLGLNLRILSGYRCAKRNAQVGGADETRHMEGDAVDLIEDGELRGPRRGWPKLKGPQPPARVEAAIPAGVIPQGGLGTYASPRGKRWTVHYVQRGEPARWGPT